MYGFSGPTASYSQRVWVNGQLLSEVGVTSDGPESFMPRTNSYAVYFMEEQSEVELAVQVSWHNRSTGFFNTLYFGEQQTIVDQERRQYLHQISYLLPCAIRPAGDMVLLLSFLQNCKGKAVLAG